MNKTVEFKDNNLKKAVKKLISIAKKENKIKPIAEAFKDVPTSKEDHKGKLSYYCK